MKLIIGQHSIKIAKNELTILAFYQKKRALN